MDDFVGQWLGSFDGTNNGVSVLNIEERGTQLSGALYVFDHDTRLPALFAALEIESGDDEIVVEVRPEAFDPREGILLPHKDFPEARIPTALTLKFTKVGPKLQGSWSTDIDTSGSFTLASSQAKKPSDFQSEAPAMSWEDFQKEVLSQNLEPYRYVFRGQSQAWRLQTSFHRTSRRDLMRYWNEDIPRIRRAIAASIPQVIDDNRPDHNGALLYLLQHHGYPTPMLDWSYSPYIASFFAFDTAIGTSTNDETVRIFMFDMKEWNKDFEQAKHVTLTFLHLTIIEPAAIGNARALPQQSLAAITNIDDIEHYIAWRERQKKKKYMRVFDIKKSERARVLRELVTCHGIFPPPETRVRPNEGTDNEAIKIFGRTDHRHFD